MRVRNMLRGVIGLGLLVTVSACESALNLGATGEARILMSRDTASSIFGAPQESTDGAQSVPHDTVESFTVTVVGIDVLVEGETEADASAWQTITLASGFDIDLMNLPAGDAAAQLVAEGEVAAGTYTQVRLRITNPRIVLKGDVSFGAGGTLEGGVEYEVVVPSSQQSGIKIVMGVTVEADASADISLEFDSAESLMNVVVTGAGQVMVSPVIRPRN